MNIFIISSINFKNFAGRSNACGLGGSLESWGYQSGQTSTDIFAAESQLQADINYDQEEI